MEHLLGLKNRCNKYLKYLGLSNESHASRLSMSFFAEEFRVVAAKIAICSDFGRNTQQVSSPPLV